MSTRDAKEFFNRLEFCFSERLEHPQDHPIIHKCLTQALESYRALKGEDGDMSLRFEEGNILINGKPLDDEVFREESCSWFYQYCRDRKINEVILLEGLEERDLLKFIDLLHKRSTLFTNIHIPSQVLLSQGVYKIQINPLFFSDSFEAAIPLFGDLEALDEQVPGDVIKNEPFVPSGELELLKKSILRLIGQNKLNKVAESLTLIQRDLRSRERENRELAFPSYRVVVRILIEKEQYKALYAIIKSIPTDLRHCKDPDLYGYHLQTLMDILVYFRKNGKLKPVIVGLSAIAEQAMVQSKVNKRIIDRALTPFLEPGLVKVLLTRGLYHESLKPYIQALFKENGLGILHPVLHHLYQSNDKLERKMILDLLRKMGTDIYAEVIAELTVAIEDDREWYIKRNLLALLSIKPPPELASLLVIMEEKETHHKVRDAVLRCIYVMKDRKIIKLGKRLLDNETSTANLMKLLGYVGAGRRKAYAPNLIMLSEGHPDERVQNKALLMLGKLDSQQGSDYLKQILGRKSFFKSKAISQRRVIAAQALSSGRDPKILSFLSRFSQDKDKEVRAIVQQVAR